MTYWDTLLAHSPDWLWKCNESAGVVAIDSSGHEGRHGTLLNGAALGAASIIPAVGDTGYTLDGVNDRVELPKASWMNGSLLWAECWHTPTTAFADYRELMGKVNQWQVWIRASGRVWVFLHWHINTSNVNFLSTNALVLNQRNHVAIRLDGAEASVWINGVKDPTTLAFAIPLADSAGNFRLGASSIAPSPAKGVVQGYSGRYGAALSDAAMLALYTAGLTNASPSAPGELTSPIDGETQSSTVIVDFPAATDAEGNPLQYEADYRLVGAGGWTVMYALRTYVSAAPYIWNVSALANGAYEIRVRAHDGFSFGAYRQLDGSVNVLHAALVAAPVLTRMWRSDFSVWVASERAGVLGADNDYNWAQWQIETAAGDFSTPEYDSGQDAVHRTEHTITGLPPGTELQVRMRRQDRLGNTSAWSEPVPFRTLAIHDPGNLPWLARDRSGGDRHGAYGSISGVVYTDFVDTGLPELGLPTRDLTDWGFRSRRLSTGSYSQVPDALKPLVRWQDADLVSNRWSVVVQFFYDPAMVGSKFEVWGFPGSHFCWVDALGYVVVTGTVSCAGGQQNWQRFGPLVPGQMNTIGLGFYAGSYVTTPPTAGSPCSVYDSAGSREPAWMTALNGDANDATLFQQCYVEVVVGADKFQCAVSWRQQSHAAGQDVLFVGHGSSNVNFSGDSWASGGWYTGGPFARFIFWHDWNLSAAEYGDLYALLDGGYTADELEEYLLAHDHPPYIYTEFDEPERPNKPVISFA